MDPKLNNLFEELTTLFPHTPRKAGAIREHKDPIGFSDKFSVECLMTENGVGMSLISDKNGKHLVKKMFESTNVEDARKTFEDIKAHAISTVEGKVKVEDKDPAALEKELIEQQKSEATKQKLKVRDALQVLSDLGFAGATITEEALQKSLADVKAEIESIAADPALTEKKDPVKEGLEVTISSDDKEVKVSDDGNKVKVTTKGESPEEKAAKEEEAAKEAEKAAASAEPVAPVADVPAVEPVIPDAPIESKVEEKKEEKELGVVAAGEQAGKELESQVKEDEAQQAKDLADANKEVRDAVATEGKVAVGDKDPAALEKELIETIELRPFVEADWLGLAGAEKPSDTQEPLIGEVKLDGKDAVVVVDKNSVHVIAADGERQVELSKDMAFDEGKTYAAEMAAENTQAQLVTNGFVVVSGTSESTKRIKKQAVVEADSYKVIAAGLTDKAVADRIAQEKKGRVIADDADAKKFMVVVGEKK